MDQPACYGDADVYDPKKPRCFALCPWRKKCAEIIEWEHEGKEDDTEAWRRSTYGSYTRPAPVPPRPPQPTAAPAITPARLAPQEVSVVRPVPLTAGGSLVSYRPLADQPGKELGVRAVSAGVAAIFTELGRFFQLDGYRLWEVATPPAAPPQVVKLKCPSCGGLSEQTAKFCQGCGAAFG